MCVAFDHWPNRIKMLTSKPSKVGKVVICGMKGVGKTAILEQLIYGNVTPDTVMPFANVIPAFSTHSQTPLLNQQEFYSTIEDTYVASVDTGRGIRDILRIYDTAGLQGTVQVLQKVIHFSIGKCVCSLRLRINTNNG